jgi:Uma2 family endonuclease/O-antigen ligase
MSTGEAVTGEFRDRPVSHVTRAVDAVVVKVPPLESGDRLTRREFERRYQAMPHINKAELIEGVVYMPSPVSASHSRCHGQVITWLGTYCAAAPGVDLNENATVRLDTDNEVQPDALLRLDRAQGGISRISADDYVEGAPELIVEIAISSASYDLHDKMKVYRRNGVQEYVVWQTYDKQLNWFQWSEGEYVTLMPDTEGVIRSQVFPGLHLSVTALLDNWDNELRRAARWIARSEILIAPLVALFLLFPTQAPVLTSVGLVVLAGVWLARWVALGHPLCRTPLDGALLLLLAIVPVAVWASADRELSTVAMAYLMAGVFLFVAVAHWTRAEGRAWWIWGGLVGLGLALSVLAPFGMHISGPRLFPLPALYTRWAGRLPETINANVMAGALVILWPIPLAGLQFSVQRSAFSSQHSASRVTYCVLRVTYYVLRLAAIVSTLLLLATLVLTQSRGAYLAAPVGALVFLGLRWPRAARMMLPLALALTLAGGSLIGWGTVADELTAGEATSGLDKRVEIWSRALYAVQDFPYTGLGLGTFEQVVAVLYPLFLHPEGTVPHAHNLYLQVAVDMGLLGLVAYLALLGLAFATAFATHRRLWERGQWALAGLCAACIAGLAGMCVHGLLDAVTWGTKLAFVPWVVIGLVVGLGRVARGEERDGEIRGQGDKVPPRPR